MIRRPQGLFRITAVYVPKGKSQNINGNKIAVFNEADRVNFKCDYKDNIALNAEELQILEGMTIMSTGTTIITPADLGFATGDRVTIDGGNNLISNVQTIEVAVQNIRQIKSKRILKVITIG